MEKFLVLDFETTGNKPKDGDQIIQIGSVLIEDRKVVSEFTSLINPGIAIPAFIQQLTHISDEMVQDAPPISEIMPTLLPMLEGAVLVAHNVFFDLGFLQQALVENGYKPFSGQMIDTVELSRLLLPQEVGYRLSDLTHVMQIKHEKPHQADSDARATAEIFLALLKRLDQLPFLVIQRLKELTKGFSSDISALIAKVEQNRLVKGLVEESEEMDIYRQLALRQRKEAAAVEWKEKFIGEFPLFLDQLDKHLSLQMDDFEFRPGQRDMMEQIYKAFSGSKHLLVEAGTGTGKSLAYLIPSLYWALDTGEKVVVSTHTIQLQEQLFARDVPLLHHLFWGTSSVALLKGRNNYLCLRKFEQSLEETEDHFEIQLSKGQILTWLTETQTGDLEEINLPSGGQAYLRQVQSDAHSCLNRHCPWFSRCYYHSARRRAQEADVIITNHSLMFTDLKAEHRILPSYRYAVIDEAHHFEDVASQQLGHSLNSIQLEGLFADLASENGTGILERLKRELKGLNSSLLPLDEKITRLEFDLFEAKEASRNLFSSLYHWGIQTAAEEGETAQLICRLEPGFWNQKGMRSILAKAGNVVERLTAMIKELQSIYETVNAEKEVPITLRSSVTDLHGLIKECMNCRDILQDILLVHDEENVYWMELEGRATWRGITLHMAPIDVSTKLFDLFFSQKESVILTSATLSVNQSFGYSLKRLGLLHANVKTVHYSSPFDYSKQTLFCVPSDLPSLKDGNEREFTLQITAALNRLARVTQGRMLVLFTSFQMLRSVYGPLKEELSAEGFTILGHGMDTNSRSKLVRQFRTAEKSVLLGTSSFWEGVDIPGEDLTCLVIVRLPFLPPTHPVVAARSESIKKKKGNPFMDLSVPQAVIRFKQGFGRLVRSQKDKGIVIVFDKRLVESRYGKYFLRSLPETKLIFKPVDELLPLIDQWLG